MSILNCEKSFAETVDVEIAEAEAEVEAVVTKDEKSEPRKTCLYCGNIRKPNVVWYDAEYCSGKCKKADGGEVLPATPYNTSEAVTAKREQIAILGNILKDKRAQLVEVNVRLESLRDEKGRLMSFGQDVEANRSEYEKADATRKGLESDILLIETRTIPQKNSELDAIKKDETQDDREALLDEKEEYVAAIQNAFETINIAVASWRESRKHGVSLNPKEKDLFGQIIIFDDTRKGLRPRIAGKRKAKLSVYPDEGNDDD